MRTRYLTGLSTTLLTAGLTLGALGLHPALPGPELMRGSVILCMAAVFPWLAAASRRQAETRVQHDIDTYNRGFLDGLAAVRAGLLDPTPPPAPGHHEPATGIRYLHSVSTYQPPTRQAQ